MLSCQINTNMNKNGFLFPTKCLEGVLKYSYLVTIILHKPGIQEKASNEDTDAEFLFA